MFPSMQGEKKNFKFILYCAFAFGHCTLPMILGSELGAAWRPPPPSAVFWLVDVWM